MARRARIFTPTNPRVPDTTPFWSVARRLGPASISGGARRRSFGAKPALERIFGVVGRAENAIGPRVLNARDGRLCIGVRRGADGSKDRKGRGRANEGGHAFHIDLSLWIGAMPIGFRATPRSDLWWRLVRDRKSTRLN